MSVTHHLLPTAVNAWRWAALLGVCLLGSCNPDPVANSQPTDPTTQQTSGSLLDLKFDRRYYDSIALGPPYSERTKREWAIRNQLSRLNQYKRGRALIKEEDGSSPENSGPVTDGLGDKLHTFPNDAALLADIYQKMDSLKVLENIPLTPYPSVESYEN